MWVQTNSADALGDAKISFRIVKLREMISRFISFEYWLLGLKTWACSHCLMSESPGNGFKTRLAVKGYPCEDPGCIKTFATASHKRRHMRTRTSKVTALPQKRRC